MDRRPGWAFLSSRWLLLIFLLALVIRLFHAFFALRLDPFLSANPLHGDAVDYDLLARNLALGRGFTEYPPFQPTSFRAPLYPIFLASLFSLFGPNLLVVRLAQALLGAFAAPIAALIADTLFGRKVAILAGIGVACFPLLVYFGGWVITDTLFIFLFTTTVLLAIYAVQRGAKAYLTPATALFLGLSILTRPQAILLLPLLMLWFAWLLYRQKNKRWFLPPMFLVVAVMVILLPWTIRNYSVHGEWIFISTQGGYTFYGANNPQAFGGHVPGWPLPIEGLSEIELDREYYRLGLAWIREAPGDFLQLLPQKFVRLWAPMQVNTEPSPYEFPGSAAINIVYLVFLFLAAFGATRFGSNWRTALILLFSIFCFVLTGLIYYGATRYALPMAPFLVILASLALVRNPLTSYWQRRMEQQPGQPG